MAHGGCDFQVQQWNWLSLQQSEMFIDTALNPMGRAPAERNNFHIGRDTGLCFAPLERGESFGGRAFYKHLAPLGRSDKNVLLLFQIEFANRKSTTTTIRGSLRFRFGFQFPVQGSRFTDEAYALSASIAPSCILSGRT